MVSTTTLAQEGAGAESCLMARKQAEREKGLVGLPVADTAELTAEDGGSEELNEAPVRKLYFVRIPRPPVDNSNDKVKKMTDDFQARVEKLKKINAKVQAKREEMRELRTQMQSARALKGDSQPEYEEKLTRLKQLQELKKSYLSKMSETKEALKGLECKSEEELDAKLKEMEDRISHDANLTLSEEKALVKHIGVLRKQRETIKGCDSQKASVTEMESECSKIKAVIADMDSEFSILKGERDSAQKIINGIYTKLTEREKEMKELEEEQSEAIKAKNAALEKLDKTRDAMNSGMKPYRENRTFSLKVRDMVAAGQVEEALALCEEQVDAQMSCLSSDDAFRATYSKLWSEQRKTSVSPLLPQSCTSYSAPTASKGRSADGPRAVANGAEKAKSLIANLLAEATKEVAVKKEENARARALDTASYEDDQDVVVEEGGRMLTPGEIVTAQAEAAVKKAAAKSREPVNYVSNPAAKAAEVFATRVKLPDDSLVPEFELPQVAKERSDVDVQSKEQVRVEQRMKAKEAEERKVKKAKEAEEKKVKAAERAKAAEAEAKVAAEKAKAVAEARVAAEARAIAAKAAAKAAVEAEAAALEAASAASGVPRAAKPAAGVKNIYAKTTTVAAAKRPASKGSEKMLKAAKKYVEEHQNEVVVAAFVLLTVLILIMASFM